MCCLETGIFANIIAGNLKAERLSFVHVQKFVRKSNRSLHKGNLLKDGIRKANKAPTLVKGYRLFDKVKYDNRECFILGRRKSGYFDLRTLDGEIVSRSANVKKLKLLEPSSTLLIERKTQGT